MAYKLLLTLFGTISLRMDYTNCVGENQIDALNVVLNQGQH